VWEEQRHGVELELGGGLSVAHRDTAPG
jgi:hypothetical protein